MKTPLEHPMEAMQRAHGLAQSGDLKGAADICRRIVAKEPANFYALFMLGTIEGEFHRFEEAERLLSRAVKLEPRSAEALTSYGNVLIERKRHADAIAALTSALALQPQNVNALIYRGLALAEQDRHADALKDFDRALAMQPQSVFALNNRANALIALNRHNDAKRSVETLLRLAPNYPPALANAALLLARDKRHAEALSLLDRALALDANNADLMHSRGLALTALGRHDEALAAYDNAVALQPANAAALINRANALMEMNLLDDALTACEKAIAAKPDYAPALITRANLLLHLGHTDEALANHDKAVAADPGNAEAHYHRGSALLLSGRFPEGFADFEHRWNVADCGFDRPVLNAAQWRGEPLDGRSIVVYSEQGIGDTIQFARFLPRLAEMGAKLTFLCHPRLVRLFQPLGRQMEVTASTAPGRPFDFQCALMSLPLHLGIESADLPGQIPYVFAEEPAIALWRERIGGQGFKIGICWQGNPKGQIDKGRSVPLARFAPLAQVPGVRLISLQRIHGLDQMAHLPAGMTIETLGVFDDGEDGFVDTAAIMQSLDLIVTSDTAIPHLAGALGRPVWVALKHIPDWRFMLGRRDSPWYPTMRLFRQPARGDWDSVFAEIAESLRTLAPSRSTP